MKHTPNADEREPMTLLLRLDEVARQLRISRSTVYRMIEAGELPVVHIGADNRRRIEAAALSEYVASRRAS